MQLLHLKLRYLGLCFEFMQIHGSSWAHAVLSDRAAGIILNSSASFDLCVRPLFPWVCVQDVDSAYLVKADLEDKVGSLTDEINFLRNIYEEVFFFSYLDTLGLLLRFIIVLCFFICTFVVWYPVSVTVTLSSVSYCKSMESCLQTCFFSCWCCSLLIPSLGAAGAAGQHQGHLGGGANGQQPQPEHGADRGWGQSPVRGDRSPQPRGGRGLVQEQGKEEIGVIGNTASVMSFDMCAATETLNTFDLLKTHYLRAQSRTVLNRQEQNRT